VEEQLQRSKECVHVQRLRPLEILVSQIVREIAVLDEFLRRIVEQRFQIQRFPDSPP
jgi:hypothetical protein